MDLSDRLCDSGRVSRACVRLMTPWSLVLAGPAECRLCMVCSNSANEWEGSAADQAGRKISGESPSPAASDPIDKESGGGY